MPILIGLAVLAAVVLVLAASSAQPGPAPAPQNLVTLAPGAQAVTADAGTSIAIALPKGASWVSLSTVNGAPVPLAGTAPARVVASGSGVVTALYRDASGQTQGAVLQVTARPIG